MGELLVVEDYNPRSKKYLLRKRKCSSPLRGTGSTSKSWMARGQYEKSSNDDIRRDEKGIIGKLQEISCYLKELGNVVEIEIINVEENRTSYSHDDSVTSKTGHSCQSPEQTHSSFLFFSFLACRSPWLFLRLFSLNRLRYNHSYKRHQDETLASQSNCRRSCDQREQ